MGCLNVGLANLTRFTVGNWVIIIGILLILVNALLIKRRPELFSILTVFVLGYFIDFWLIYIFSNVLFATFLLQLLVLCIGITVIAFGASIYLQAEFARIPVDGLMLAIKDLLKVNFFIAKTITELLALVLAFIVGGPIGLGTVFVTFLIGPMIQWFYPLVEKRIQWKEAKKLNS
ncbi:YitT family protein [Bacillus sp. JCM 19034]|uniref:YczE/YyaS/YitT family protein n=1 Tax=Bacillus sp. JCM 19034 TaxID=1481928 RepID=UPI000A97B387|nr:membrane protein [Bacillus sp. JCM 19034]